MVSTWSASRMTSGSNTSVGLDQIDHGIDRSG
jgi:hypothetical protein